MSTKITKIVAMSALGFMPLALTAAEQVLEVKDYQGISLGVGLIANISCGDTNTLTIKGDKKSVDNVKVLIEDNVLQIKRKSTFSKIFDNLTNKNGGDSEVTVDIITTGQLSAIELSTGSQTKVADCAINTSSLAIDMSTGATARVEGTTAHLDLDMSTGSTFNARTANFTADIVNLDMSTGATANLCNSQTVSGDASTGVTVYVKDSADVENLDLSLGANTSSRRCQ